MKKLTCLSLIVLSAVCACAQSPKPAWHATIKVIDDEGQPVVDADVGMSFYVEPPPGQNEAGGSVHGLTDTNGIVRLSHAKTGSVGLGFQATKAGYYPTTKGHEFTKYTDSDPEKWNPNETLVLEKIINPIPMYARRAQIEVPVVDKPTGFDFVESDWVAPNGKGKQSDIIFMATRRWDSRHDFEAAVQVTFPNSGDGLLAASVPSVLGSAGPRIPVTAPLDGYIPEYQVRLSNTPAGGWKDDSQKQNYYVRIRTSQDKNGNVKSALYGKIYGGFTLDPINSKTTLILFTYYFNPKPNSRNVEFNPSKNMLQGLPFIEQVKEP